MTRRIKCALIAVLLISISCSGKSIILEDDVKQNELVVTGTDSNEEIEKFVFFRSFQFCDNPYAALTSEEAERVYLNKEITLDRTKTGDLVDWASFLYEGAMQCVEEELGEKHSSSHLFSANEDFPFDNIILFNNNFLLVAQDGFFFAFKEKKDVEQIIDKYSFESTYQKCKTIELPIEYSYDFILELENFSAIDQHSIEGLEHLTDFQFSILPSINETKLLLVSGYMESGQSELHLFTLNNSYEKVDAILLYTSHEIEEGSISTRFNISKDYRITITKEQKGRVSKLLEEKLAEISPGGNFVSMKK